MTLWAGLGYYSRARNLHRCAQAVVDGAWRCIFRERVDATGAIAGHRPLDGGRDRCRLHSARGRRSSTATSSGCSRACSASTAFPAKSASRTRCGHWRSRCCPPRPRRRRQRLHAGLDGPRRDALRARQARLRALSVRGDCVANVTGRQRELPAARPKKAVPTRRPGCSCCAPAMRSCSRGVRRRVSGADSGACRKPRTKSRSRPSRTVLAGCRLNCSGSRRSRTRSRISSWISSRVWPSSASVGCARPARRVTSETAWVPLADIDAFGCPRRCASCSTRCRARARGAVGQAADQSN